MVESYKKFVLLSLLVHGKVITSQFDLILKDLASAKIYFFYHPKTFKDVLPSIPRIR
jgi:hypothetical protein